MRKTFYFFALAVAVSLAVTFVGAGLITSAQNTNSSTTRMRGQYRERTPEQPAPKKTGRCDPMQQEQTDLSGTYVGQLKHGDDPYNAATLTISGNTLTMTSGSDTHTGRITAVTTCGYTAVTIMVGDGGTSGPGKTSPPNRVVSLRAKKVGDSLTLMSVPGEKEKVIFTTGGGARRPRRSRRPPPPPPPSQ